MERMATEYYHLYRIGAEVEDTICQREDMVFSEYASWKGTYSWYGFREHQLVFAAVGAIGLSTKYLAIPRPPCPDCASVMPSEAERLEMDDFMHGVVDRFGDRK